MPENNYYCGYCSEPLVKLWCKKCNLLWNVAALEDLEQLNYSNFDYTNFSPQSSKPINYHKILTNIITVLEYSLYVFLILFPILFLVC